MKKLGEMFQKIRNILEEKGVAIKSMILENNFIKVLRQDGDSYYYTIDSKQHTCGAQSIVVENKIVKLSSNGIYICYYTLDLKTCIELEKCESDLNKNGEKINIESLLFSFIEKSEVAFQPTSYIL